MAEEQQEVKKEEQGEEQQAPKKSKKKLLILIVLVVVLGGAGAYFFLFSSSEPAPASQPATEESVEDTQGAQEATQTTETTEESQSKETKENSIVGKVNSKGEFGETFTLKPFNINLGNPMENRYVRLELAFEYKGKNSQRNEIEKRMPQLRDAIISVTGKKSREFLLSADGKDQLRKELLIVVNRYMSRPIEAVYITDILID